MHLYEWLAVGYFGVLALAARFVPTPRRPRLLTAAAAGAAAGLVVLVAAVASEGARAVMPHVYLLLGYWLPGWLVEQPTSPTRFERWLAATDAAMRRRLPAIPGPLVHLFEIAYLVCYPLVPASWAVIALAGQQGDVNRFWTAVLGAGFASYVVLPLLVSRPPRLVGETASPPRHVAVVNARVLRRFSHELNTFPSGHVAISAAAAAVVCTVLPAAGVVVAMVAAGVAIGAVAGKYHYVADVIAGLAVAALVVGALAGADLRG
jgi:membrane-associated phospholipid phosphatase